MSLSPALQAIARGRRARRQLIARTQRQPDVARYMDTFELSLEEAAGSPNSKDPARWKKEFDSELNAMAAGEFIKDNHPDVTFFLDGAYVVVDLAKTWGDRDDEPDTVPMTMSLVLEGEGEEASTISSSA
jgi:hypothetical protein